MKKYIVLSLLLIITCVLLGQERPDENDLPPKPLWVTEAEMAEESNYIETFADALKDPNILIGVFEWPDKDSLPTMLSTGEILEVLPGYEEANIRFNLCKLHCVKSIKGKFIEPVVLVPIIFPPWIEARPAIPAFIPLSGSKWVLAVKKTSQEYRIERFDKDIEKYKFLNDNTVFMPFRYGHGALCLKWPEENEKFYTPPDPDMVKVSESIVDDFEAIQRVMPFTQKKEKDPNEMAAIDNTSKALKTDAAKSIFTKILSGSCGKVQDPNDR